MDASFSELVSVLREARVLLAHPDNDFVWSSWQGAVDALSEVDGCIASLEAGIMPPSLELSILFAPTGPIQEVSLSSGWGQEFLAVAERFDHAFARAGAAPPNNALQRTAGGRPSFLSRLFSRRR